MNHHHRRGSNHCMWVLLKLESQGQQWFRFLDPSFNISSPSFTMYLFVSPRRRRCNYFSPYYYSYSFSVYYYYAIRSLLNWWGLPVFLGMLSNSWFVIVSISSSLTFQTPPETVILWYVFLSFIRKSSFQNSENTKGCYLRHALKR